MITNINFTIYYYCWGDLRHTKNFRGAGLEVWEQADTPSFQDCLYNIENFPFFLCTECTAVCCARTQWVTTRFWKIHIQNTYFCWIELKFTKFQKMFRTCSWLAFCISGDRKRTKYVFLTWMMELMC